MGISSPISRVFSRLSKIGQCTSLHVGQTRQYIHWLKNELSKQLIVYGWSVYLIALEQSFYQSLISDCFRVFML
jgi:hypothetical protein